MCLFWIKRKSHWSYSIKYWRNGWHTLNRQPNSIWCDLLIRDNKGTNDPGFNYLQTTQNKLEADEKHWTIKSIMSENIRLLTILSNSGQWWQNNKVKCCVFWKAFGCLHTQNLVFLFCSEKQKNKKKVVKKVDKKVFSCAKAGQFPGWGSKICF